MGHHFTGKGNRKYGSYVCQTIQTKGAQACPGSRVAVGELDAFVVDRVQALGRDLQLVAETVAAAKGAVAEREPEIRAELRALRDESRKLGEEQQHLVDAIAKGGKGTDALQSRLGEIEERQAVIDERTAELRAERKTLTSQTIDEADLRAALESFTPVWDELFPQERAQIMALLLERVTVDARQEEVEITFRASGIRTLLAETQEEAA